VSHEIEFDADGRAQVLGHDLWWHELNEPLGRNATWDDVKRLTPVLAMTVEKIPMSDLIDSNEGLRVYDDEFGLLRSDGQILRTGVGDRYEVVQAPDFYDWGHEVVETLGLHGEQADLVSAVSIRGGRQYAFVFEQAEVEVNGVAFKGYFNLLGSHDLSITNSLRVTPVVTVCGNTYRINRTYAAAFNFRHTLNVQDRMDQALEIVRGTQETKAEFEEIVRTLTTTRLELREFDLHLDTLFPTEDVAARTLKQHERAREAVRTLFKAPLNNGVENTGWSFVQAVNSYEQWSNPIRKVNGLGTSASRAVRQFDAIAKGTQPLTDRAVELVLAG
jgi:phage/plasmid-like protein (TIGR03299 family)